MTQFRLIASIACCTSLAAGCSLLTGAECRGFRPPVDQTGRATIAQGIAGNVWFWQGDFMPSSDACHTAGTVTPVVRTILVYQPPVPRSAFEFLADTLPAVPIDSARSDATGFFELALPVGWYSVVVREGRQLFVNAPTMDAGVVGGVEVKVATVRKVSVDINYKATY